MLMHVKILGIICTEICSCLIEIQDPDLSIEKTISQNDFLCLKIKEHMRRNGKTNIDKTIYYIQSVMVATSNGDQYLHRVLFDPNISSKHFSGKVVIVRIAFS